MSSRRDDVEIIGLAGRDSVDAMQAFVDRHGLGDLRHLVDEDGSLWAAFGVVSQPTWVFVDDDGTATTVNGALGRAGLDERIDGLVAG